MRVRHTYISTIHPLDAPATDGTTQELLDSIAAHSMAAGSLTGLVGAG